MSIITSSRHLFPVIMIGFPCQLGNKRKFIYTRIPDWIQQYFQLNTPALVYLKLLISTRLRAMTVQVRRKYNIVHCISADLRWRSVAYQWFRLNDSSLLLQLLNWPLSLCSYPTKIYELIWLFLYPLPSPQSPVLSLQKPLVIIINWRVMLANANTCTWLSSRTVYRTHPDLQHVEDRHRGAHSFKHQFKYNFTRLLRCTSQQPHNCPWFIVAPRARANGPEIHLLSILIIASFLLLWDPPSSSIIIPKESSGNVKSH